MTNCKICGDPILTIILCISTVFGLECENNGFRRISYVIGIIIALFMILSFLWIFEII